MSRFAQRLTKLQRRALRCWIMTHRNLSAWVAGVYGWLGAGGRVARHEVLLMPGGRVSVHTVPVSSHVGNHRD